MDKARLWAVEWEQGDETLSALEPTDDELRRAAPVLAAAYNDSHNRVMMGHDEEPHSAGDVVAYYEQLRIEGGRPFLLYMNDVLVGDADFRNIAAARG